MEEKLTKIEFSKIIKNWLHKFLINKYGKEYEIIYVDFPERTLDLLNNHEIKKVRNICSHIFLCHLFNFKLSFVNCHLSIACPERSRRVTCQLPDSPTASFCLSIHSLYLSSIISFSLLICT